MSKRISSNKIRRTLRIAALASVVAILAVYLVHRLNEDAYSDSTPAPSREDKGIVSVPSGAAANEAPASGTNHKTEIEVQKRNAAPKPTPSLSLAAELASSRDNDVGKLAQISQQALSCQARRKILRQKDSLERELVAAKDENARASLREHYAWLLSGIKKAETDTDEQCDSLSDSDLDIVARESTLRAAALGDTDSQMCAMYILPDVFAVSTDKQQAVIGHQVEDYLSAGLARGDWRAVRLIGHACGPRAGVARLGLACEGLPIFRMQVILALGATGERRKDLMDDIGRMVANTKSQGGLELQGKKYSEADLNNAMKWAEDEYSKNFQNSSYDYNQPTCNSQKYGIGG